MRLNNYVQLLSNETGDVFKTRSYKSIQGLAIHRIGSSVGRNGLEIARAFQDTSKYAAGSYTGGKCPYHFIIRDDEYGTVDQLVAIYDVAPHSAYWNHSYIGIACIGDFRAHPPNSAQWESCVNLCAYLLLGLPDGISIMGHTELPHSGKDPDKECPGKFWEMEKFRKDTRRQLHLRKIEGLQDEGITLA